MTGTIIASLLSALSEAALFVFAKLVSKEVFAKILEKVIIAIAKYADDKTESDLVHQVHMIVIERLGGADGAGLANTSNQKEVAKK